MYDNNQCAEKLTEEAARKQKNEVSHAWTLWQTERDLRRTQYQDNGEAVSWRKLTLSFFDKAWEDIAGNFEISAHEMWNGQITVGQTYWKTS